MIMVDVTLDGRSCYIFNHVIPYVSSHPTSSPYLSSYPSHNPTLTNSLTLPIIYLIAILMAPIEYLT